MWVSCIRQAERQAHRTSWQSTLGLLGGATLAGAYNDSLEASVARHFPGNQLINCMCHSTVNLYR